MSLRTRIRRLARARRAPQPPPDLRRIEQRVQHLEALVEGLQDAVHRDSIRHEERLEEIDRRTRPEALAKALSEDARRRGL